MNPGFPRDFAYSLLRGEPVLSDNGQHPYTPLQEVLAIDMSLLYCYRGHKTVTKVVTIFLWGLSHGGVCQRPE